MAHAIVLAAGASQRMGQCKASLPWHYDHTMLSYQVENWRQLGVSPIVVLSPKNAYLSRSLPCTSVVNSNPDAGKTRSILLGLAEVPTDAEFMAIAAVDQPRPIEVYQRLIEAHRDCDALITAPTHQTRIGHPLIFSPTLKPHLDTIAEETFGLRNIIQRFKSQIQHVSFEDPIVTADMNTPIEYKKWFYAVQKD